MAKSLLNPTSSLFEIQVKPKAGAEIATSKPHPIDNVQVKIAANGGYIVSYYNHADGMGRNIEKVYESMDGVVKCLNETLGKGKESEEYEEEE